MSLSCCSDSHFETEKKFHVKKGSVVAKGDKLPHNKSISKIRPRTGHEGPEAEQRYSSTLSLISALDGVGG
jgi:hypothetical protein